MVKLSVVIPAYNEEKSIVQTIDAIREEMKKHQVAHEIIVVDDGSTDSTYALAFRKEVKVFQHPQNIGYGAAIKTGIHNACGENIAIIDADQTYPVDRLMDLYKWIDQFPMVVGARTGKNASIPLFRRPVKWFLTRLAMFLCEMDIPDLNSGFRIFRKDIALKFFKMFPSGFSFTTTITLCYLTNGFFIKYVPISYQKRVGKSKIRPFKDTINFLIMILRTITCFNPLKIFIPVSLLFFALFLASLVYDVVELKNITEKTILFFVAGVQVVIIGLLSDLIDKRLGN